MFSPWMVKFAEICKFHNLSKHTAHWKQALGVTLLSNLSISEQTKLKASPHSNMSSHVLSQRLADENHNEQYKAMDPALTREFVCKQDN